MTDAASALPYHSLLTPLLDFVELLDTFFKTSASPQGHLRLVLISASTNFHSTHTPLSQGIALCYDFLIHPLTIRQRRHSIITSLCIYLHSEGNYEL